jgi:catechol 2,3-dioxygenase-like lactoylglutathione lyase family enzyme
MLAYTTIGTNDLPKAAAFYDALFAILGAQRAFTMDRGIAWGVGQGSPMFSVMKPFDGQRASVGNGVMVALTAADAAQVQALHAKALELGGTSEGQPGPRGPSFYMAYFRDLDGNKLAAFAMQPQA